MKMSIEQFLKLMVAFDAITDEIEKHAVSAGRWVASDKILSASFGL